MLATKFDVRGQTGGWAAKDVERDDSFNKESGHATIVSIRLSTRYCLKSVFTYQLLASHPP